MPALMNAKHERFAQEIASGKKLEEAHRNAGFAGKRQNAHKILLRNDVTLRVGELLAAREEITARSTAKAIEKTALTKEWIIERLRENVMRALRLEPVMIAGEPSGEYRYEGSVANRALELLGKEIGMFIDRKEVRTGPLDAVEPGEAKQLLDAVDAELARRQAGLAAEDRGKPH